MPYKLTDEFIDAIRRATRVDPKPTYLEMACIFHCSIERVHAARVRIRQQERAEAPQLAAPPNYPAPQEVERLWRELREKHPRRWLNRAEKRDA
jgi:hypothetical protein